MLPDWAKSNGAPAVAVGAAAADLLLTGRRHWWFKNTLNVKGDRTIVWFFFLLQEVQRHPFWYLIGAGRGPDVHLLSGYCVVSVYAPGGPCSFGQRPTGLNVLDTSFTMLDVSMYSKIVKRGQFSSFFLLCRGNNTCFGMNNISNQYCPLFCFIFEIGSYTPPFWSN
jgi:hypothetical protein